MSRPTPLLAQAATAGLGGLERTLWLAAARRKCYVCQELRELQDGRRGGGARLIINNQPLKSATAMTIATGEGDGSGDGDGDE